jgi:hypothetical protein
MTRTTLLIGGMFAVLVAASGWWWSHLATASRLGRRKGDATNTFQSFPKFWLEPGEGLRSICTLQVKRRNKSEYYSSRPLFVPRPLAFSPACASAPGRDISAGGQRARATSVDFASPPDNNHEWWWLVGASARLPAQPA